jgi:hypothetical protein
MVLQCDQTIVGTPLRIMYREEVGQSLQRQVRFLLRGRLQHVNNINCSGGSISARWRGLGLFTVAAVTQLQVEHAHSLLCPICGTPAGRPDPSSIR